MARLDRLGPAKEVARIGAVIGREFSHELIAAVAGKSEPELASALVRLVAAGLLFSLGAPPHANYLFKHALVQDAAYGTLLREQRRTLHARIAETLESRFAEIAERQPELLARHYTEAGQIEKAADLWAKAGQRSFARSALAEATEQLGRALDLIATLPGTPELRRIQIRLQVALITSLGHVKGFAAPETKAAIERARLLIEQAESVGEPPARLFSVLFGLWVANLVAFNGDAMLELASEFLTLAEKQGATVPLMIGHRLMGASLLHTGRPTQSLAHFEQAVALYDPAEHRALTTRFGVDARVSVLSYRSWALWMLGYPQVALADADCALKDAQEIGHVPTLMFALTHRSITCILCGNYAAAHALLDQIVPLANEKGALFWRDGSIMLQGYVLSLTGKASDGVEKIISGSSACRSTGATMWLPLWMSRLAGATANSANSMRLGSAFMKR